MSPRPMLKVFIADQSSLIRAGLREIVKADDDFRFAGEVDNGHMAQRLCLQIQPHVAIVDSSLPGPSIIALVDNLYYGCPKLNILILTDSAGKLDMPNLVRKGIGGCILQSESDVLIAQAIRTVGLGAVWFSRCFITSLLQQESASTKTTDQEQVLTQREAEVVKLVAEGLSNRQIANTLRVKERTIEFHMTNVLQKLNMNNRVAVAMWAKEHTQLTSTTGTNGPQFSPA